MAHELSPQIAARAIYSRSLQYFWEVARTGSIREASRNLNVAPSAVSRQISQLQDRLDIRLFYNLGNSLRLSPAGELLLEYCESIFTTLDTTISEISALQGYRTGTVRIVTVGSFASDILGEMIHDFSGANPGIHIETVVCSAAEVAERVRLGEADLGFTFGVRDDDVLRTLYSVLCPTVVVVSRDHPLASQEVISFEDCLSFPIGLLNPSSRVRRELEIASTCANAPWPRCFLTNSINLLADLAAQGQYITYQPKYGFGARARTAELVYIPMHSRPQGIDEEFVVISDRRIQLSPAVHDFSRFAVQFLQKSEAAADHPSGQAK